MKPYFLYTLYIEINSIKWLQYDFGILPFSEDVIIIKD